jgi:L-lactate utilization protein LutC
MAWFSSTFGSLTSSPDAYSTTKTGVAATSAPSATPKRYNELTSPRQRQQSKSERQTKVAQHKLEREQSESARMQDSIISILEAAGDKPVLSPPTLRGQDLQRAIEAIGDKDVVIAPTDPQEDWQQALYEEFLRWRTGQLISQ